MSPTPLLRRALGALAAAAIAVPALATGTAVAAPVYDTPLSPAAGTTWSDGACAAGAGVTVVSDTQGADAAVVRCVTNKDGSAYSSKSALQSFADAGLSVVTQTSAQGAMVCQIDGAPTPNPCDEWKGVWWSFWIGTTDTDWTMASTGADSTAAATDSAIGLSLVDNVDPAPAPRVVLGSSGAQPEQPGTAPGERGAAITAAADFLARELAADNHLLVSSDFPDNGLTSDVVLALMSAGAHKDAAVAATNQLQKNIGSYIGADGESYAGATAKSLVVALATGVDPKSFGGVDLIGKLQSLQTNEGRFSDKSQWGDYSNTIVQSLAIIGLEGAGVGASQKAVDYLTAAQCDDGGFALNTGGKTCVSDPDATSFAVQALMATPCAVQSDIDSAVAYLTSRQAKNGGLGGGASTEAVNANSTGLAGAVFSAAGQDAQADAAADYLATLQYDASFPAAVRGGLAYNAAAFAERKAAGDSATVQDQDRRATAQGLVGLTGTTYAELAGAVQNAPERVCATPAPKPSPGVKGPVVETDIPGGSGLPVVELGAALLFLTLLGGGAAAAVTSKARRGTRR